MRAVCAPSQVQRLGGAVLARSPDAPFDAEERRLLASAPAALQLRASERGRAGMAPRASERGRAGMAPRASSELISAAVKTRARARGRRCGRGEPSGMVQAAAMAADAS